LAGFSYRNPLMAKGKARESDSDAAGAQHSKSRAPADPGSDKPAGGQAGDKTADASVPNKPVSDQPISDAPDANNGIPVQPDKNTAQQRTPPSGASEPRHMPQPAPDRRDPAHDRGADGDASANEEDGKVTAHQDAQPDADTREGHSAAELEPSAPVVQSGASPGAANPGKSPDDRPADKPDADKAGDC
jgi:hypothetical protein